MKAKWSASLLGMFVGTAMVLAAPASAATEFGSDCPVSTGAPGFSSVALAHSASNPLPLTAPVSGVITSWRQRNAVEVPPEVATTLGQRLQVLRPTGALNQFTVIAESATVPFSIGLTSGLTRLPVQVGDHLGLSGTFVSLLCVTENPESSVGFLEGGLAGVGSTGVFEPNPGVELPAVAVIEPDADNDGYGDETQDLCPQSAAYQTPCPVVTINSSSFGSGKKSLVLFVATSLPTTVSVSGIVGLGKGKKTRLRSAPKAVGPGGIVRFKLNFNRSLRKRLRQMPAKKKLTLRTTASAVNVVGAASTDVRKVKLRGQK